MDGRRPMMPRRLLILLLLGVLISAVAISTFLSVAEAEFSAEALLHILFINIPGFCMLFALNFCILRFRSPSADARNMPVLRILTATFAAPVLLIALAQFILHVLGIELNVWKNIWGTIFLNSVFVLLLSVYFYDCQQMLTQQRLAQIEHEKLHYQFEALKAQIKPHFLFNSLNVLSSLVYRDPDKANLFTKRLAEMYRYVLQTEDRQTVSLSEELRFLEAYLYMERIRFDQALSVEVKVEDESLRTGHVPPTSIQLLVENAIKHNCATPEEPLRIEVRATANGISVSNTLQRRPYVSDSNGKGLDNLRQQYQLHEKDIEVELTDTLFVVRMPYLHAATEERRSSAHHAVANG